MKSIGEKVLGWFIVEETDGASAPVNGEGHDVATSRDAAEVTEVKAIGVAPAGARAAARLEAPAAPKARLSVADASTTAIALAPEDRERLGRVLTLLERLPAEATPEVKRAIVGASLEAFGVRVDAIIASSQRALAALDAFTEATRSKTAEATAQADARIAKLHQEIAEIRRTADAQRATNDQAIQGAAQEKVRLEGALAFFRS